jgi:hypothetical protein
MGQSRPTAASFGGLEQRLCRQESIQNRESSIPYLPFRRVLRGFTQVFWGTLRKISDDRSD